MLTSFFGKSNPINFLILSLFILFGFIGHFIITQPIGYNWGVILNYSACLIICVFSMLLVDFIIRKNALTRLNTFGILFFTCFLFMFPAMLLDKSILISNLILLLAFRRILSLKTERNLEKKILDASIWISIAALFYTYSILYFVILFASIFRKTHTTYKHLLIPFVGFLSVFICLTAYNSLVNGSFDWFYQIELGISKDFSAYNSFEIIIPLSLFLSLLIWAGIHRIYKLPTIPKKWRPNYLLMLLIAAASIIVVLSSPQKTGAELVFLIAPTAIIVANYIEESDSRHKKGNDNKWFKEGLLWLVIVLPIVLMIS